MGQLEEHAAFGLGHGLSSGKKEEARDMLKGREIVCHESATQCVLYE